MKLPKSNLLYMLVERRMSTVNNGGGGIDVKAIASEKATQIVDSVKQNMTSSIQFVDDTLGVTEVSIISDSILF